MAHREEEKRVWKEYRVYLQTNSSKDKNDIDQALIRLRQSIVNGASLVDIEEEMDSLNSFYEEGVAKGISQWEMAINLFMFTSLKKLGGRTYSEVANERGTVLLNEVLDGRLAPTSHIDEDTHLTKFSFKDQLEIYHFFSVLANSASQFTLKTLEQERFWDSEEVRYLFCVLAAKCGREDLAKEIAATLYSDEHDYMVIKMKYGIGVTVGKFSDDDEDDDDEWGWNDFWEGPEDWDEDEYDDDDDDDFFDEDDDDSYDWDDDEFWAQGKKRTSNGYSSYGYYQEQPYRRETPKVGRNDPCPCGSGKKYKNCCGK